MKKHVYGRRLKRDVDERKSLFKGLLSELVMHERIQTTEEKAKSIKADADKLITKAKKKDKLHAYMLLQPLVSAEAVKKLVVDLAPHFVDRAGGYTRIVRLQRRFNDNAKMAMIEWTERNSKLEVKSSKLKGKETKELPATINEATTEVATPKKAKTATKKVAKKTTKKSAVAVVAK